jgi:hypothetical protein
VEFAGGRGEGRRAWVDLLFQDLRADSISDPGFVNGGRPELNGEILRAGSRWARVRHLTGSLESALRYPRDLGRSGRDRGKASTESPHVRRRAPRIAARGPVASFVALPVPHSPPRLRMRPRGVPRKRNALMNLPLHMSQPRIFLKPIPIASFPWHHIGILS